MKKLTVRDKSKKQEKATAKDLGGKTTIASGALVQKGDVFNDTYLVECKTSEKDVYTLKKSTWDKIRREAVKSNLRTPIMRIDLKDYDTQRLLSFALLTLGTLESLSFDCPVVMVDKEGSDICVRVEEMPAFSVLSSAQSPSVVLGKLLMFGGIELVQIPWGIFVSQVKINEKSDISGA